MDDNVFKLIQCGMILLFVGYIVHSVCKLIREI